MSCLGLPETRRDRLDAPGGFFAFFLSAPQVRCFCEFFLKVPSNPNYAVILWCCHTCSLLLAAHSLAFVFQFAVVGFLLPETDM